MRVQRRAVITGIGVVAPNGIGKNAFWESLLACRSGIGLVTLFDTVGFPSMAAGEVKDFRLEEHIQNGQKPRRLARHTQLALVATKLAIEDAGLDAGDLRTKGPIPLVMGVSTSAIEMITRNAEVMTRKGPDKVSSFLLTNGQPQGLANAISEYLHVPFHMSTVSTACTAGLEAVTRGVRLIQAGEADLVIAGAADAPINSLTMAALFSASLIPSLNGHPSSTVSRPFDRTRIGGIPAEGGAILVIENLQDALARGARIYAEAVGCNGNSDVVGEEPSAGLRRTMQDALVNAGLSSGDIDYVCAAGPSDPILDRVETDAIKAALGAFAYRIPVSSIKGVTGNPLSAGGPLQVAATAMAITQGLVPPTANYEHPDPACDLDYVPRSPRRTRVGAALVNSHGLGGSNYSIVLREARI